MTLAKLQKQLTEAAARLTKLQDARADLTTQLEAARADTTEDDLSAAAREEALDHKLRTLEKAIRRATARQSKAQQAASLQEKGERLAAAKRSHEALRARYLDGIRSTIAALEAGLTEAKTQQQGLISLEAEIKELCTELGETKPRFSRLALHALAPQLFEHHSTEDERLLVMLANLTIEHRPIREGRPRKAQRHAGVTA